MSSDQPQLQPRPINKALLSGNSGLPPVLHEIVCRRPIDSFDELDYSLQGMINPENICNLQSAAQLLANHVEQGSSIVIFGDYDADGATSTALCLRALAMMGHHQIRFLLPDRITDGYGLSLSVADRLLELKPDLVITVDTGIASLQGIERLVDQEVDVIITDHHLPGDDLPNAQVIVNPNAFDEGEGHQLAGVGVAFYLMLALRIELRSRAWFADRPEPNLADCLDLVAIGTIADLVPLDHNNRLLVHQGLLRIRAGQCSEGVLALVRITSRDLLHFSSQDIAFSLAPRINAAGRLDDMTIGVQALLSDDVSQARILAQQLDEINRYRRELQGQMTEQAMALLPEGLEKNSLRYSHVLHAEDWHEGIVGIIASKVKDLTFRPSICFALSEDGSLKGSCRSIKGVHMRDMLDLVDKQNQDLIIRFGGHAMAAGVTILPESLSRFSDAFEEVLRRQINEQDFSQSIEYDGAFDFRYANLDTVRQLLDLSPWGQRFPLPSFVGEFLVTGQRVLAERHIRFQLLDPDSEVAMEAMSFYASEQDLKLNFCGQKIKVHYELSINEFRGNESVQLIIRDMLVEDSGLT